MQNLHQSVHFLFCMHEALKRWRCDKLRAWLFIQIVRWKECILLNMKDDERSGIPIRRTFTIISNWYQGKKIPSIVLSIAPRSVLYSKGTTCSKKIANVLSLAFAPKDITNRSCPRAEKVEWGPGRSNFFETPNFPWKACLVHSPDPPEHKYVANNS